LSNSKQSISIKDKHIEENKVIPYRNELTVYLVLFLFASPLTINAQTIEMSSYVSRIDQLIQPYVENKVFSGTILVAKEGRIIYNKGVGQANLSWSIENSADTKYGIGSITKTITATLIMQLVQEGKLKLADKISRYLPDYPKEKGDLISIHHLLSHRSGIPNYFKIPGWTNGDFNKSMPLEQFEQVLNNLPLSFPPGETYMYSNSGYYFLGKIIERVSGKSLSENLKSRIFIPANMLETGLHLNQNIVRQIATSYQFKKNGHYKETTINRDLFRAAGDLYSTAKDLFQFEQALYSERLLSDETKRIMFSDKNSYGWKNSTLQIGSAEKQIMSYTGQLLGFNSMMTRFTQDQSSIVIIGNIGTSYLERSNLTQEIAKVLFDQDDVVEKTRASMLLHKAVYENNLPQTIQLIDTNRTSYRLDENGMLSLAQQLTWSGLEQEAISIRQLVAKLFQKSPH